MSSASRAAQKLTRFFGFSARRRERLARSVHLFLLGVIVASAVEVLVDWHATLTEVRILAQRIRERGENYVAVLSRPLGVAVPARDMVAIERLTSGVFDDEEVVFVRVLAPDLRVIYERTDPEYAAAFNRERHTTFDAYYSHQIERDEKGILQDPEGLRERMRHSRHRDVPQMYGDLLASLHVQKPPGERLHAGPAILFQDRLYSPQDKESHDASTTYAIGRLEGDDGKLAGAVIVAFDMKQTNHDIRWKYLKGAGLVLFFVMLIIVQNRSSRRDKLRLLDLEARMSSARASLAKALPPPRTGEPQVAGALSQSPRAVDGMIFDLFQGPCGVEVLIVDPAGDGLETAAVALHLLATYRHRREENTWVTPRVELESLIAAARRIPNAQDLALALVRVGADGEISGLASGIGTLRVLPAKGAPRAVSESTDTEGIEIPTRVLGGRVEPGEMLLVVGTRGRDVDADSIARKLARESTAVALSQRVTDTVTWARGEYANVPNDLALVAVERTHEAT